MMKSIIVLLVLVAAVIANDVVQISGQFSAPVGIATWQSVQISNLLDGNNFTNMVQSVSFVVRDNSNVVYVSYPYGSNSYVGNIVAGASGFGSFQVVSNSAGNHILAITAKFIVEGESSYSYSTKFFDLHVGSPSVASHKRATVSEDLGSQASDEVVHSFADRNAGDYSTSPSFFVATDSVTTWNGFAITTNDNNLHNVTWTFVPDDLSVLVGYPGSGNGPVDMPKNTTYSTSVSFTGNPGTYNINITLHYLKGANMNWKSNWAITPLFVSGDSTTSTFRIASPKGAAPVAEGNTYVRADVVIGVAVGAVALVAVIAVVAAIIVMKKSTPTSSV